MAKEFEQEKQINESLKQEINLLHATQKFIQPEVNINIKEKGRGKIIPPDSQQTRNMIKKCSSLTEENEVKKENK